VQYADMDSNVQRLPHHSYMYASYAEGTGSTRGRRVDTYLQLAMLRQKRVASERAKGHSVVFHTSEPIAPTAARRYKHYHYM